MQHALAQGYFPRVDHQCTESQHSSEYRLHFLSRLEGMYIIYTGMVSVSLTNLTVAQVARHFKENVHSYCTLAGTKGWQSGICDWMTLHACWVDIHICSMQLILTESKMSYGEQFCSTPMNVSTLLTKHSEVVPWVTQTSAIMMKKITTESLVLVMLIIVSLLLLAID